MKDRRNRVGKGDEQFVCWQLLKEKNRKQRRKGKKSGEGGKIQKRSRNRSIKKSIK